MARSKYGNRKTVAHGREFASQKEARRYEELLLLQRAGEISQLEVQPVYRMEINDHLVCKYLADFRYLDKAGATVVEDVKGGPVTQVFQIKRKLLRALHGVEVVIV